MLDFHWSHPGEYDKRTETYICPHCDKTVSGTVHEIIKFFGNSPWGETTNEPVYSIVECPSCHEPTIIHLSSRTTSPIGKALQSVKHLPDTINDVYEEIRTGIAAECYTSSVVLSRTAIMHIAVDQGAKGNESFEYYVDYLSSKGYIPPNAKDWVDKIRKMANAAVHRLEIWKQEDAELIGKFLMYLLIFIYELPQSI